MIAEQMGHLKFDLVQLEEYRDRGNPVAANNYLRDAQARLGAMLDTFTSLEEALKMPEIERLDPKPKRDWGDTVARITVWGVGTMVGLTVAVACVVGIIKLVQLV